MDLFTILSPKEDFITNNNYVVVSGVINNLAFKPVMIKINGKIIFTKSDGTFSSIIDLVEGINVITIVVTDFTGKSSTILRNVTFNKKCPVIHNVSIVPNSSNCGTTCIVTVKITDE